MKRNGIFYISAHGAAVAETQAFLKQRPRADLATQSGPMLVIDGRLHPRFDRRSAFAESAHWCRRTRGWQSHIRRLVRKQSRSDALPAPIP